MGGGQVFHLQPRDLQAEKILTLLRNNPNIPNGFPEACLKAMFDSSQTYGLFSKYFDTKIYQHANSHYETHIFNRRSHISSVVGVTRVLEDMEISQRNHSPYQDMKRFIEEDFCRIHDNDTAQIINKFKSYFTARVDIKLIPQGEGDFQIVSVSDDEILILKPDWFNKDGIGYEIHSYAGKLEIISKATADGNFRIILRGLYVRNPEDKKLVPYWIDYTKLTVNGKVILDKLTPVWHNKTYSYSMDAKAGDEIKIQVEWLPHRSDT